MAWKYFLSPVIPAALHLLDRDCPTTGKITPCLRSIQIYFCSEYLASPKYGSKNRTSWWERITQVFWYPHWLTVFCGAGPSWLLARVLNGSPHLKQSCPCSRIIIEKIPQGLPSSEERQMVIWPSVPIHHDLGPWKIYCR